MSGSKETTYGKQPFWNNLKVVPYQYILPNMILFIAFMIIPIFITFYYSLLKWNGMSKAEFIGFDNYHFLFHDEAFLTALKNTVVFTIVTVPFLIIFALFFAVLLNQKMHLRGFFRSAMYMPAVVSSVAVGMVFSWLFNSQLGLINYLLNIFNLKTIDWCNDPKYAMIMIVVVTLWSRIGYNMVIYLAGLQGISPEYYEAATIDGANSWQSFRFITWPLLRGTNTFILITCVIYTSRAFDLIYVMTKGGPLNSTTTLVVYVYNEAFRMNYLGRASGAGVVLFLILLIFTIFRMRTEKENA